MVGQLSRELRALIDDGRLTLDERAQRKNDRARKRTDIFNALQK